MKRLLILAMLMAMLPGCAGLRSAFYARGERGSDVPAPPRPGPTLVEMSAAALLRSQQGHELVYRVGAPPRAPGVKQSIGAAQAGRHMIGEPAHPWPMPTDLTIAEPEIEARIEALRNENANFVAEKREHTEDIEDLSRKPRKWSFEFGSELLNFLLDRLLLYAVCGIGIWAILSKWKVLGVLGRLIGTVTVVKKTKPEAWAAAKPIFEACLKDQNGGKAAKLIDKIRSA